MSIPNMPNNYKTFVCIIWYVLQSKEAGADDILDISGCELSEVGANVLMTQRLSGLLMAPT